MQHCSGIGLVFSIRFMGCMGGPARNLTCNSTIPGRVDSGNTPRRAQYITSWPFAHPCCAAAFFSLSVKCDKKQRNCAFRGAPHHHSPSIRHLPCFLTIVPSPTWFFTCFSRPGVLLCSVLWVKLVRKRCDSEIQTSFDTRS